MSDLKIAESLGIDFVIPEGTFDKLPAPVHPINDESRDDEAELLDDFDIAREALKGVIQHTTEASNQLARQIKSNSQEVDFYEAQSKMASTVVGAATALINLHRIKKQVGAITNKTKVDQTTIIEGDVTMIGTMGDILDKAKTIDHS